jgi:uncharacterized membrane protein HdeD (DUF308 family)
MKEMDKKHMGGHMKHKGAMMIVLGGLILANVYWLNLAWGAFVGGVFVLGGLVKLVHCGCECKCKEKEKGKK